MKTDATHTVPLQLLTIQTKDGQRWIFVGSPAVLPAESIDENDNAIVDVWFSNIQDVPQDASIRSLIEMMDKQNLSRNAITSIHAPGSDTLH